MSDSKNKKPMWPQNPDGTTDWDAVFEHPATGLIAIVAKAKTPQSLKETTTLVIKKLFTRDDDASEVKRFLGELDSIIAKVEKDDQLSATVDAISGLLRIIKEERKEQAREYLEKKKKGIAPKERRARRKKNTLTSKIIRVILAASDPKIAIPLIAVMILVVVGSVVYFASMPKEMTAEEKFMASRKEPTPQFGPVDPLDKQPGKPIQPGKPVDIIQPSQPGQPTEGVPLPDEAPVAAPGVTPDEAVVDGVSKWPRPVLVQPMDWPLIRENKKDRLMSYATIIYVNSADGVSAVCVNYPATKESLLVAFGSVGIGNNQPDLAERTKIAEIATRLMNKRVGNHVDHIEIIPYGHSGYRATNTPPCRIAR